MEASPCTSTEDTERQTEACMIHARCSSSSPGFLCRELPHEDTWREADKDAVAKNHALASTFEDQENPSFAKRQRRPSVRLEDLGDQHVSPAADKRKKKTGKSLAPGICMSNEGLHKWSTFDDGDDARRGNNALSCCLNGAAEPSPAINKTTKLQQILKITGKKVRNGGKKPGPGVRKVAGPVKKFPRAGTSIRAHGKQKVGRIKDAKDIHFDKENNAHTPTRIEASIYHDAISPFERSDQDDMVLLHAHQNYRSGEFLTARTQVRGDRANQWTQALHAFKLTGDADGKHMAHANRSLHVPKGKLVVNVNGSIHGTRNKRVLEANGNGDSREISKNNAVRQCLQPWFGVRKWLQDLGLGKYAQLFEAHEVEPEVLPLLTLDDLREMGVAAVGSRRKMFYAIQHIRKALVAETE